MKIPQFQYITTQIDGQKVNLYFFEDFVRIKGECVTIDVMYKQFIEGDWKNQLQC